MQYTVYILIPDDMPDPLATVRALLEPYRRKEEGKDQSYWYFWDYWYFANPTTREGVERLADSCFWPYEAPDPGLACGLLTSDGEFHDWMGLETDAQNWGELDQSLDDNLVVVVRLHS